MMGFLARFRELKSEVDGMDSAEKLRLRLGALAVLCPVAAVSMLQVATGFCRSEKVLVVVVHRSRCEEDPPRTLPNNFEMASTVRCGEELGALLC